MRRRRFLAAAGACCLFVPAAVAESPARLSLGANEGEVLGVDREAGEIIIRHGPLPEIDMPAMSMAFNVADPQFFSKVRKGDRVRFRAGLVQSRFAITSIERLRSPSKR